MKAIIIDDEPAFRLVLEDLLSSNFKHITIQEQCADAISGFSAIKKHAPDIVFLDVEMPGMSGVELLDKLPDRKFDVVFTTSHDKYALQALKQQAADYLIKPVNIIDLTAAIDKITKRRNAGKAYQPDSQVVMLPNGDGLSFYQVNEIVRCESDANYTTVHLATNEKVVITKQLGELETLLSPHGFYRTHKSHLINLQLIKRIVKSEGGYIIMQNGEQVPLSRTKKEEFLALYGQ